MRILFIRDPMPADHPLSKEVLANIPEGLDVTVMPSKNVEAYLHAKAGYRKDDRGGPPEARHGKRTMGYGPDRGGGGIGLTKIAQDTLGSVVGHAERVVVCADAVHPKFMPSFLSALGEVNPHADCLIHAFLPPPVSARGTMGHLPSRPLDLVPFACRTERTRSPLSYGRTLSDMAGRIAGVEHAFRTLGGFDDLNLIPLRSVVSCGILELQFLYWLRDNGGLAYSAQAEDPLGLATRIALRNRLVSNLHSASLVLVREGLCGFELTLSARRMLNRLPPPAEDPDFLSRFAEWSLMDATTATTHIEAYMFRLAKVLNRSARRVPETGRIAA